MKIQRNQKVCVKLKNCLGLKIKVLLPLLKPQMMCVHMIFDQVLKRLHMLRFPTLLLDILIFESKQCINVFRNFLLRFTQLLSPFFLNQEYFYSLDNSVQGSKPHFPVPLQGNMHNRHNVDYSSMYPLLGEQRVTKLSCSFHQYLRSALFLCFESLCKIRYHLCMHHQFFRSKWFTFDFHVSL